MQAGRWLMYVTAGQDVNRLTRLLDEMTSEWKAFAVSPSRIEDALGSIQPQAVVFDAALSDLSELERQARGRCCHRTLVTSDADLSRLNRLLSSM